MSTFGGIYFTSKGRALQAKALTGVKLNFTKLAVGDGSLNGQAVENLSALIHEVKTLEINKLKTMSNGKATIGGILSNQNLTSGFYWRELGLFAQDPDLGEILYCYGNAGNLAEYIPSSDGADALEKRIDIVAIVGNAANVCATIDTSLVYASISDLRDSLNEAKSYTDSKIPTSLPANGGNADTVNNHTASGTPDTTEKTDLIKMVNEVNEKTKNPVTVSDTAPSGIVENRLWLDTGTKDQYAGTVFSDIGTAALTTTNKTIKEAINEIDSEVSAHKADYTLQIPFGGTTTNSGNDYSIASPSIVALSAGMAISVKINADSTAATTLNWNGKGAKSIKKANGNSITNLKNGGIYTFRYDGTNFILQGEGGEYGTATADRVLTGYSIGTENGLITGTMPNYLTNNNVTANAVGAYDTYINIYPKNGAYNSDTGSIIKISDGNFWHGCIVKGITCWGLTGTAGRHFITTASPGSSGTLTVLSCPFQPTRVFVLGNFTGGFDGYGRYGYFDSSDGLFRYHSTSGNTTEACGYTANSNGFTLTNSHLATNMLLVCICVTD